MKHLFFRFGRLVNIATIKKTIIQLSGNNKKSRTLENMKYMMMAQMYHYHKNLRLMRCIFIIFNRPEIILRL